MGSSLVTVLTSALVAGAVTLAIEVLAKPYIEVRKDRLVRRARDRDDASRNLILLAARLQMLRFAFDDYHRFGSQLDGLAGMLDELTAARSLTFDWLHPTIRRLLDYEMGSTKGLVEALILINGRLPVSEHPDDLRLREHADAIYTVMVRQLGKFAGTVIRYLSTPRRHMIRRMKLRRSAARELETGGRWATEPATVESANG